VNFVTLNFEDEGKTLKPMSESFEAKNEAKANSLRPRLEPKFWP